MKIYRALKARRAIYAAIKVALIARSARRLVTSIRKAGQPFRLASAFLALKAGSAGEPPGRAGETPVPIGGGFWRTWGEHGIGWV